ncbi:hypothetical protein [Prevotella sp.]|uniref:hypothetical protein n=1 Tax=Prevotella sp. TaxID=59823 RepID=UPI0025E483BC|nr:hypothetical protein [Prevotella sp.]
MKTEEINPGDILYDKERKMLVKVARVDEDGVVKYSAITDMRRIFQTPPPPYRVGARTADAYVPATDEQRKYMERQLAVCEYINLPKNNRMEVLAYIIADLKAENVELEQRVHQLIDDYNDVVRQLNGIEKHDPNTGGFTLGELTEALDKCEALEKDNKELANEYRNLEQMYNELNEKYNANESIKEDLRKSRDEQEECINRFKSAEFVEMGQECQYKYKSLQEAKRKVGEGECCACPHLMKADVFGKKCLLCAYLYDNKKEHDAHESMATDE